MRRINKAGNPPTDRICRTEDRSIAELSREMLAEIDGLEASEARRIARDRYFDDRLEKQKVREILFREQGGLCAFCEGRVAAEAPAQGKQKPSGMQIAHWVPLSVRPATTLTWSNLFGSCHSEGHERGAQHCDVFQGNNAPPDDAPTPAEASYDTWLEIRANGSLMPSATAPSFVARVIDLFNLNAQGLMDARAKALEGLQQRLAPSRGVAREYRKEKLQQVLASLDRARLDTVKYPTAQRLWLVGRLQRA